MYVHVAWHIVVVLSPGMVIVRGTPRRSLTTGGIVVMGDELILPSALGVRFPLIRTSQLPPPSFSIIHPHPVYLNEKYSMRTIQHSTIM